MKGGFLFSPRISPPPPSSPPRITFSESILKETIATVEPMIRKWDMDASTTYERISYLFRENRGEAKEFLSCVNDLQHAMNLMAVDNSSSDLLSVAHNLMQIAMKRLQKEFYTILSGNRYFLDSSGTVSTKSSVSDLIDAEEDSEVSVSDKVEKFSDAAVGDLKDVAECMMGAGYGKECTIN